MAIDAEKCVIMSIVFFILWLIFTLGVLYVRLQANKMRLKVRRKACERAIKKWDSIAFEKYGLRMQVSKLGGWFLLTNVRKTINNQVPFNSLQKPDNFSIYKKDEFQILDQTGVTPIDTPARNSTVNYTNIDPSKLWGDDSRQPTIGGLQESHGDWVRDKETSNLDL